MIDVQPYHDKLDKLKEYMEAKIDGIWEFLWINIDSIPEMTTETFLRLFAETGMMFCNGNEPSVPTRKLSFEEWYNNQTQKLKQ